MPDDPHDLGGTEHVWVLIDVAAKALGLSEKRTAAIARTEGWRTGGIRKPGRPGQPPKQYLWSDIVRTYHHRKDTT